MKHQLGWTEISLSELAEHLQSAVILRAQAIGENTLYHCRHDDRESIAIAQAGGGLIVGLTDFPSEFERRRARPCAAF